MSDAPLAERLATVMAGIEDAARDADRDPVALTTVVVTKFQPASLVRELVQLGVRDFGESRHQEARAKSVELSGLGIDWHFVGQLQSKKARQAREYTRVLHSLDRDSLLDALATDDANESVTDSFIQVNLSGDPGRGGVAVESLDRFTDRVLATGGIRLLGVMAVAPIDEAPRSAFSRLREAAESVRAAEPGAGFMSAGMSADYRDAIREGATHLRIGTAITGNRPDPR